jgi:hypothetical protein
MLGNPDSLGLIPRAMEQIFSAAQAARVSKQGWRYEMRAAMLEIYNEELRDLLGKGPPPGKKHQVCACLLWMSRGIITLRIHFLGGEGGGGGQRKK